MKALKDIPLSGSFTSLALLPAYLLIPLTNNLWQFCAILLLTLALMYSAYVFGFKTGLGRAMPIRFLPKAAHFDVVSHYIEDGTDHFVLRTKDGRLILVRHPRWSHPNHVDYKGSGVIIGMVCSWNGHMLIPVI